MLVDTESAKATSAVIMKHCIIDDSRTPKRKTSILSPDLLPRQEPIEPTLECLYGRIRYNSSQKALLLNFDGLHIQTEQHVKNVRQAIANILESHSKKPEKVNCLVNYDGCVVDAQVQSLYDTQVDQYLTSKYYKSMERFTTKSFLQEKIASIRAPVLDDNERIIGNRYVIEKALGEGTYGKVYLAVDRRTENHVAIKEYSKRALLEMPELSRFVEREISILSQVKFGHPNIINLLDYISTEEFHFLVMEFCQLGCLESPYNPHQQFSEEIAHRYFVQMVDALSYLHETIHAVHLDLQLSNVCVDINDNIKIVDFGVGNYYSGETMTNLYGNSLYACPEMLLNKPYHGPDADIWSLGCCLYKMLTGYHPFRNAQKALVRDFMIPLEEEEELSEDVKDLLNKILCLDLKKRSTLSMIKEHVWFKNGPPLQ